MGIRSCLAIALRCVALYGLPTILAGAPALAADDRVAKFTLPFEATDAVFDPVRPYMYVSQRAAKKLFFVNLTTGLIEREQTFHFMPEALALSPDGSRLYVALVTRDHDPYWWDADQDGYIASFDLATQAQDRYFRIPEDPYDLVATGDGRLIVSPGSGQWARLRVYDAVTGQPTAFAGQFRQRSRLSLHSTGQRVYSADTESSPSDIRRHDLLADGTIVNRWDSPYHGQHRMDGNVWASPLGDVLVTRGGDLFTSDATQPGDMLFVAALSAGPITDLAWDAANRVIFTLEGSTIRLYNLITRLDIGSFPIDGDGGVLGLSGDRIYATIPSGSTTRVVSEVHPALRGAANTPPSPRFTISPGGGRATQTFDASATTDAEDVTSSLQFRWDFDNDGMWDTAFDATPTITHAFDTTGTKLVRLQVRDPLGLVAETSVWFDVAFEATPVDPTTSYPPFAVPFPVSDVAFDPARPYAYVSHKATKRVYLVNLHTGFIERDYAFTTMPESLALTPDGSRLFAALLTREHDGSWPNSSHEAYIASWDLATQVKDREFHIVEDPRDMLATSDGHLVVSPGSGGDSFMRVFDAVTGQLTGSVSRVSQGMRLTLHPSEATVYAANTNSVPSDILRFDLLPAGGIAYRWDSPYHGDHRMDGRVWASPAGDVVVTRGGDVYTVGAERPADMLYVSGLSAGSITDLLWDGPGNVIFSLEGSELRYYNLTTRLEIGSQPLGRNGSLIGMSEGRVNVAMISGPATYFVSLAHPAPGGETNAAPVARFAMSFPEGPTTQIPITFDATASTDAEDGPDALEFRWDFENDGIWDTTFQSTPIFTHRYETSGSKSIHLQVRDHLRLVGDVVHSIDVPFEPDPGAPGPEHLPFSLPFAVTDAVFDPMRPYVYVSQKSARKVYFVNLTTGRAEREFSFSAMPEALALSPDGSRLFVALLAREHSLYWYDGDHAGSIASFDLARQVKDRHFPIGEDPYDLVATTDGHLVVSSGSGQWTYVRAFDATTGEQTGAVSGVLNRSHLTLHPSEGWVYAADADISPTDIRRFNLLPGGGIVNRWDSPYHGEHRMDGNVWSSPLGSYLITRGGDVFTSGATRETDMYYLSSLTFSPITDLVWDTLHGNFLILQGSSIVVYDLNTRQYVRAFGLGSPGSFVGWREWDVYGLIPSGDTTDIAVFSRRPKATMGTLHRGPPLP